MFVCVRLLALGTKIRLDVSGRTMVCLESRFEAFGTYTGEGLYVVRLNC